VSRRCSHLVTSDSTPADPAKEEHVGLSIGIVGLPNVGKSTLFNALTQNEVLAANYPFATIEPNVGVVPVPDARLDQLAEIFGSGRTVPASVTFVDIAGIVRGASEGEGLGNKFLAAIRESDAICQVVRSFEDDDVIHVEGRVDPLADIETINTELILADLQTIENRLPKMEKEGRKDPEVAAQAVEVAKAAAILNQGRTVHSAAGELDLGALSDLHLLTAKPFLYVFNVDEGSLGDEALAARLAELVAPAEAIVVCAQIEAELASLEAEDLSEMLDSYGLAERGLDRVVASGFATLGLQTYLTAGPMEARAWTIEVGDTAPKAAGVIHTDFERGFIKAEIVSFRDLVETGSMAAAKAAGKVRLEGKDYVMADGDVVEFRFNV
jgi:GTP-binding protein YchF